MKEEENLRKRLGEENPFRVPEGYFDRMAAEVMERLPAKKTPEEQPVSMWVRLKPLLYMAAMFVGAALIIRVASSDHKSIAPVQGAAKDADTELVSDEMLDVALNRAMMDGYSLYVYLNDASAE